MDAVKEQVEALTAAIRESAEYHRFREAKQKVYGVPGLESRVREYCWKIYEIQNSDEENLDLRMEEFENQYQEFQRHPVVAEYLESELRLCRMFQQIHTEITNVVELLI